MEMLMLAVGAAAVQLLCLQAKCRYIRRLPLYALAAATLYALLLLAGLWDAGFSGGFIGGGQQIYALLWLWFILWLLGGVLAARLLWRLWRKDK